MVREFLERLAKGDSRGSFHIDIQQFIDFYNQVTCAQECKQVC
jgi:hypothetical protein